MVNNKGITLIALIITIIILLILAGVTINIVLGENGLFSTAKRVVGNYQNEQERELGLINQIGNTINENIGVEKEQDYNAKKEVNKPLTVGTGLVPVTINADGTLNTISDKDANWYNYIDTSVAGKVNASRWANAKTADGSLWVWIPRYAYKITYKNPNDKLVGGTIDVVFLKDDTNKDFKGKDVTDVNYVDEKGQTGAYIVHPAFRDGSASGLNNGYANGEWNDEITGFWMAKFEAGYAGTAGDKASAQDSTVSVTVNNQVTNYYGARAVGDKIKYPVFKANRPSMNYLGISDLFDLCKSLTSPSNPYGLTNRIDSHLTKNSEWGAVAYLTHSKYGINGQEVRINNINANDNTATNGENTIYAVTGYGASSNDAGQDTSRKLAQLTVQNAEGSWTTSQGQKASSTGNIYGIYDLSGGSWEFTSGYIAPATGNYQSYGGSLRGESNQYKSKYIGIDSDRTINYNETANQTRIGEAIWETSNVGNTDNGSWNGDYSHFVDSTHPFTVRGGHYSSTSRAGLFAFSHNNGACDSVVGFHLVLVPSVAL